MKSDIQRALLLFSMVAGASAAAAESSRELLTERQVERSWPSGVVTEIEIKNARGTVTVVGGAEREVTLRATLGAGVEGLLLRRADQWLSFEVQEPIGGDDVALAVAIEVHVPRASSVDVAAPAAAVAVRGVEGKVVVRTLSGGITVAGKPRELWVQSTSGKTELEVESPLVTARNVAGGVRLAGRIEELRAETVDGTLEVLAALGEEAKLGSAEGLVDLRGEIGERARVQVETMGGTARLALPATLEGDFHVEAFQGELENGLGPGFDRPGLRRELRWRVGSAPRRIEVSTFSGRIELLAR